MSKRSSIKHKLITANVMTVVIAFIIVGVIVVFNLNSLSSTFLTMSENRSEEVSTNMQKSSKENMKKIQRFFESSLFNKGKILLDRDSLVIKPMLLDFSFNGVRDLLGNLYALDEEILSLDFFTVEGETIKSWQLLNRQYPKGIGLKTIYDKKTQTWITEINKKKVTISDANILDIIKRGKKNVTLIDYSYTKSDGTTATVKAYECTVPIFDGEPDEFAEIMEEEETIGFLRYILTLEKMQVAIKAENALLTAKIAAQKKSNEAAAKTTREAGKSSLSQSLIKLGIGAVVVLILSFFLAVMVGNKVSKPILQLKESAMLISGGDYSKPVTVESNDEIGILGDNFEDMRVQVKEFTDNLQGMVDEKTKEISDILNSIEQGIFTINTDLTVNAQHSSKAEEIYEVSDFENAKIASLFNMNPTKVENFNTWLQLISQPRKLKRWKKYAELSPISEFTKSDNGEEHIIEVDYRPIIENNALAKLMILSKDVTEERKVKAALEKTKRDQQLTMERVIGLINNDQESLKTFFEGYEKAISELSKVNLDNFPKEEIDAMFREAHTVKGNAGSFGFHEVSRVAGIAEDFLEEAKSKASFDDEDKEILEDAIQLLEDELAAINTMKEKLFSNTEDMMSISRSQFEELLSSVKKGMSDDISGITEKILQLELSPFSSFCKHYANIVHDYVQMSGKKVDVLDIKTPDTLVHRDTMKKFDMAVVHLVRNSLDHGIEDNADRDAAKGPGKVSMSFESIESSLCLTIEDNGKGVNPEVISLKAVEKGILSEDERVALSKDEKVALIFHPGFSSNDEVTEISGRGVGMDAVKSSIEEIGGSVEIETEVGIGTKIILTIPKE